MKDFPGISESEVQSDPISQFIEWLEVAKSIPQIRYPEAACVSTVSEAGLPEGRMLLIKYIEDRRFVFFTNLGSPKVKSIRHQPAVELTFYWAELGRQVRISGKVKQVDRDFANDYFQSRPLDSQIGANVSQQSRPLESRDHLIQAVNTFKSDHHDQLIQRPVFWSGFELIPSRFEFWQEREYRLHDRIVYEMNSSNDWVIHRIYP